MKARNFPFSLGYSSHLLIRSSLLFFPHTSSCFACFLSSAFFHLPGLKTLDKLTWIRCVLASLSQTEVQGIQGHLWYWTPRGNVHKGGLVFWDKCLSLPEANCPLATTLSQLFNFTHFVVRFFNQYNEINIQLLAKCRYLLSIFFRLKEWNQVGLTISAFRKVLPTRVKSYLYHSTLTMESYF